MMPTVRLAMVSALAEKTRENFSYIRCWSRIMLMKSAAPQELARIMGVAMVRTSSRDLSKGRGDQQDDHHLHDLGHEGGRLRRERLKTLSGRRASSTPVHQTAQ
jgi:hypothetical protein